MDTAPKAHKSHTNTRFVLGEAACKLSAESWVAILNEGLVDGTEEKSCAEDQKTV